jgi:acyl-CoA reductase-like NAD-dependent aldehyde dehydrogenase
VIDAQRQTRGTSAEPTAGAVAGTIAAARAAQPAWAAASLAERAACLEQFRRMLYRRRRDVAERIERETGKPAAEALGTEVQVVLDMARWIARTAPGALRERTRGAAGLAMARKRVRTMYRPFGVVGVISPWNYPFMLSAGIVLPALVAGNAVVLKPSELTPGCGAMLGELFAAAGLPNDVLHIVQGAGSTGAALAGGAIDKMFFTGSVATGRRVAMACAERLVPCVLELGGSDPAIVLEDADERLAARGIAWGRFSNAGQTCVAPKRVFAVGAAYDRLLPALADAVAALRVRGSAGAAAAGTWDVGPVIDARQRAGLQAQLDDALHRGARVAASAPIPDAASAGTGAYCAPTLLVDVPPDARVLTEETFGPLLPVVRARDAAHAVALANATDFGLSASVWGRDAGAARDVARKLQAGSVVINDTLVAAGMADVPHGGMKASGSGRSHGIDGLLECVQPVSIIEDRLPSAAQPWWFPYRVDQYASMDGFVTLAHGDALGARARGIRGFLRLFTRR